MRDRYFKAKGMNINETEHHANMSMKCTSPYTPLLYGKTWIYRGEHFYSRAILLYIVCACFRNDETDQNRELRLNAVNGFIY